MADLGIIIGLGVLLQHVVNGQDPYFVDNAVFWSWLFFILFLVLFLILSIRVSYMCSIVCGNM